MIYEVRDYHYRRDLWEEYKEWARTLAIPFLRDNLDVVGFWIEAGHEPEIGGSDPADARHGPANVTWIIRWPDKATRDREFRRVMGGEGWQEIMARHPDQNGYLQTSARFLEQA
ncbi:MAG: hypothetical protein ACE5EF_02730 [Dehalococcoidia bacterium]